jgi:hypothetical protein
VPEGGGGEESNLVEPLLAPFSLLVGDPMGAFGS